MLFFVVSCLLPAFLVSFVLTWWLKRNAERWGLVDQPADRKVHAQPTALGGGIAIWAGVCLPLLGAIFVTWWIGRLDETPSWVPPELAIHLDGVLYRCKTLLIILAGGTILVCVGLLDDLRDLPWKPRMAIQIAVAAALVSAGVSATVFVPVPFIGQVITGVWILVLINAFNFLDNMDALSSGIGLIAALLFSIIMLSSTSEPRWLVAGVLLVLSGALMGFLCFNWPPASIFMGDAGSYAIGLMLSTMTVLGTFYDETASSRHVMLAPVCVLAIPLYDVVSVVLIRLKERRSPFHADKKHFSHRLVELGMTPKAAVLTIHLVTLTTGLGGLILYRVPDWNSAWVVIGMVGCMLAVVAILETAGRRSES